MRGLYLIVIILFAAVIVVFAAQNFQSVTVSLLRISANLPLAFLIVIIYLLGAVTGGSLLAFVRRSIVGARRH